MNPRTYQTGYSGLSSVDLAQFLKRTFNATEQAQADVLIEQVEAEFASMCRRNFAYETAGYSPIPIEYTERFDTGSSVYYPSAFPIDTIEEIKFKGVVQDLEEDTDYFLYDSHIEFETKPYAAEHRRALEITYTIRKFWGNDVVLTILEMAGKLWLASETGGVSLTERSFASTREIFDNKEFEARVMKVVNRYKKALI